MGRGYRSIIEDAGACGPGTDKASDHGPGAGFVGNRCSQPDRGCYFYRQSNRLRRLPSPNRDGYQRYLGRHMDDGDCGRHALLHDDCHWSKPYEANSQLFHGLHRGRFLIATTQSPFFSDDPFWSLGADGSE